MDICCTVALVPSAYSTASSASGGGMAICWPGKYSLKNNPSITSTPAGASSL